MGNQDIERGTVARRENQRQHVNSSKLESREVETFMSTRSPFSLVLDSGSTNRVCSTLQGFKQKRNMSEGEVILIMGTNAQASPKSVGDGYLHFSSNS